jgi:hypothetical protein
MEFFFWGTYTLYIQHQQLPNTSKNSLGTSQRPFYMEQSATYSKSNYLQEGISVSQQLCKTRHGSIGYIIFNHEKW